MLLNLAESEIESNGKFRHLRVDHPARSDHPFRMKLKLHIRERRKAKGLTLAQLSEKAGISVAHLSEVERGVKSLHGHMLEKLANALDAPIDALISAEGSEKASRLIYITSRLQDDDLERLMAFAQALADSAETGRN